MKQDNSCEALHIIKSWNPNGNPCYGMVDFAAEEIGALETIFPGILVFICSFHREQAWNRWYSKYQNVTVPKAEALARLREVANAGTEGELQDALTKLKSWEYYNFTPLKDYFEKAWFPEIKRWALA
ncbi:hypothetical protein JTE90_008642 [Oedothorax gibbosus]|uniref:MULE transposase domain-containing protein n=1 Tax=Oedothorax gibbosus TaxID=931172 RepID=A0AAV6U034_9ARAC|nr:hypothetical protein JTE90_008642 [Oedothorax gibbosus]